MKTATDYRQNTDKIRTTDKMWIVLIFMGALFLADPTIGSFSAGTKSESPVLSLEVRNESLADVLEEISEKSGYQILLRGEGEDLPVSIKLKDVTLEEMLRRILGKSNYTVIWNDAEKKVQLSVYESTGSLGQRIPDPRSKKAGKHFSEREAGVPDFERRRPQDKDMPDFSITGRDSRFVQATDTTN